MESLIDKIAHYISAGGVLYLVGMVLSKHTIYVRGKDRLNSLWKKHCREKGIDYVPLENGASHHHSD